MINTSDPQSLHQSNVLGTQPSQVQLKPEELLIEALKGTVAEAMEDRGDSGTQFYNDALKNPYDTIYSRLREYISANPRYDTIPESLLTKANLPDDRLRGVLTRQAVSIETTRDALYETILGDYTNLRNHEEHAPKIKADLETLSLRELNHLVRFNAEREKYVDGVLGEEH